MFCTWYKIRQNKKFAEKHKWSPHWFGENQFDKALIKKIKQFQKEKGLKPTGVCDKKTFRVYLYMLLKKIQSRKH